MGSVDFVLYTNSVSAHQLPLARSIVKIVGANNFRYVYTNESLQSAAQEISVDDPWVMQGKACLEDCECLLVGGLRPIGLIETRASRNMKTFYMSERWFKPRIGIWRLLFPKYFLMACRYVRVLKYSPSFTYLPIGIHAARDMARLCGMFSGDFRCLFRAPELDFERKPGGKIWLKNGGDSKRYCLDKMRMWGYYVEPSKFDALPVQEASEAKSREIKVLWVGRLLNLKRVDTIVRAVGEHANLKRVDNSLPKITLDIYGTGPEEGRLKKLASKYGDVIEFHPPVPISDVRRLMREHDLYVLSSNSYEGWGAVVSEALEEGMKVFGTFEAGGSATMLSNECLFHSGDWEKLVQMLLSDAPRAGIGEWNATTAAMELIKL